MVGSRKVKRTEKYVFLISAAVASGFIPRTLYGSFGDAASGDVACNSRCGWLSILHFDSPGATYLVTKKFCTGKFLTGSATEVAL